MLDVGVGMRMSLWWRVALARLALLSLVDADLCAFVAATPAGREHTAALHAALWRTDALGYFVGGVAPPLPPGGGDALQGARLCVQNVAFLHIVVGFLLPLAAGYALERRSRLAWLQRARPGGVVAMREVWVLAPGSGGHWMAAAVVAPAALLTLLGWAAALVHPGE
jgi:hypothetical protein